MEWFFLTVAAAQAIAEERRSQSGISPLAVQTSIKTATKPGIEVTALNEMLGSQGRVSRG